MPEPALPPSLKPPALKTLIVDDEENVLRAIKRLFMDEETEVLTAASGAAGLEILKANEIALIISDQRMPGMNGSEFLKRARQIAPDAIRIILTGYADITAAVEAINKGGAYRYLEKPWEDSELLMVARDALDRYRLLGENRRLTELTKKQNEQLRRWSDELQMDVQRQTIELSKRNEELTGLNTRLNRKIGEFIAAFSNLGDLRGGPAHAHSEGVAAAARDMGARLGLDKQALETVVLAARLHDIGKVGMPDVIAIKAPEDLNEDEREQYEKHPVRGQSAIGMIEEFREMGALIRHHHENFDGSGFPDGLRGRQIPLGARIIACADLLDRSLKNGLDADEIHEEIKKRAGSVLDPELAPLMRQSAEQLNGPSDGSDSPETALSLKDVRPGRRLSRDFRTGTGVLLLTKGTVLTAEYIEMLKRCAFLDPSKTSIFVWT
ncbi:MAG: response regulator [Nitrospiraceae bacterium]|nr:response regulator [Nitrospiraceae bacterium]